jgi:hypothetical protein
MAKAWILIINGAIDYGLKSPLGLGIQIRLIFIKEYKV